MIDMDQLKLFTEKMEGHLEAENVDQGLTNFQEQLSDSAITSKKEVKIYEHIARDVDNAIRCGLHTARRPNLRMFLVVLSIGDVCVVLEKYVASM